MMGMKKPPTAASVSIRPAAVPRYWCSMWQTRAGTASQAAKPKIRKKPIPIPRTQSAAVGTHGDEGQQRGDDDERPDHEHAQVPAAVGAVPAEQAARDARQPDERRQQAAGGRVEVPGDRHVLAEQLRGGEVRAVPAEEREAVDPQVPAREHGPQGGPIETGAAE